MESSITAPSTNLPITTHKWAQLFLRALQSIEVGEIELTTPDGDRIVFKGAVPGVRTDLIIHDWSFCERVFMQSDIGMGESYMKGEWDSANINGLIHLAVVNEKALAKMVKGSVLSILYYRIKHLLNRNTKKGSKRNILAHYDLGNAFYQLWLDPSMTYSSALFSGNEMSLEQAQHQKYQHILDQLNAESGAHILEVGCGWGGFAEYAADKGYRVTGITISDEQFAFAKERVARFNGRADIQLKDYRDLEGYIRSRGINRNVRSIGQGLLAVVFQGGKTPVEERWHGRGPSPLSLEMGPSHVTRVELISYSNTFFREACYPVQRSLSRMPNTKV